MTACGASGTSFRDLKKMLPREIFSLRRNTQNETSGQVAMLPRRRGVRTIRFPREARDRIRSRSIPCNLSNERRQNANGRTSMLKGSLCLAALAGLFMSGAAFCPGKIKVGVTATLEGTYTVLGEDGIRGFQTALKKFGTKIGDKQLDFVIASTDATPDSAVRAVRKLIEQDKVQILLSPLSGDEGIAVKNFAKTHPELTFVNAASGAQETTYVDPAPNFFRYNMVFGLVLEFWGAGGQVSSRQWVPLGTKDFASVIAALPDDADAIYLGL